MNEQELMVLDNEYVASTYARAELALVSGKGSVLIDADGKEYIDFGTGIAVNGLGIAYDKWLKAVVKQLKTLPHASNLYYTAPQAKLAELLAKKSGMKKVFFANSGAEANECAIKCARKYYYDKTGDNGGGEIITLKNSFHGRTLTTLSATGQDAFHDYFYPFTEGFKFATPNDYKSLLSVASVKTCAVMLELVQGEGGVNALDVDYVKKVEKFCKQNDILLIIDEVQTGSGRTGSLFCYQQYKIKPDIVTTAKGLGNGLPIGACLFGEKTENVLTFGTHGSTFGGNPAVCAGALVVLKSLDKKLLLGVKEKSEYIKAELSPLKGVKSVSGMGLMLGIECVLPTKDVVKKCREKGVIVLTAKQKIRLLPALNIDWELLKKGVAVLKEILK